jgi:hypothetical protein
LAWANGIVARDLANGQRIDTYQYVIGNRVSTCVRIGDKVVTRSSNGNGWGVCASVPNSAIITRNYYTSFCTDGRSVSRSEDGSKRKEAGCNRFIANTGAAANIGHRD